MFKEKETQLTECERNMLSLKYYSNLFETVYKENERKKKIRDKKIKLYQKRYKSI